MKLFFIPMTVFLSFSNIKAQEHTDAIFYSSLNYAIQLGQFDGVATLKTLKQHGDFGLGSQHGLAAELLIVNDTAYRMLVDGKAGIMPVDATLPFAATKFFKAEKTITLKGPMNLSQLQSKLDSVLNTNRFAALRITGSFDSLTYKCYFPQHKPYPPIKATPAKFFDSSNISGVIAGFFTPKSAMVLNSPNYHFHFINTYRTSGGHVDTCLIKQVTIEIDYADGLMVQLPGEASVQGLQLNEKMKE